MNEDDQSAACYSILHKLPDFRGGRRADFEFKLEWPNTDLQQQVLLLIDAVC